MDDEVEKIVEQIKREADFLNKARLLKFLNTQKQIRIKELSRQLKLKPAYICHILRLNRLPDIVVDSYYSQVISLSHLFVISRLKNQSMMIKAYEEVLKNNLTVLQTEELVREYLYGIKDKGRYLAKKNLDELKQKIKAKTGDLNLRVVQTRIKSKIIIEIKGSLSKTTPVVETILNKLTQ